MTDIPIITIAEKRIALFMESNNQCRDWISVEPDDSQEFVIIQIFAELKNALGNKA